MRAINLYRQFESSLWKKGEGEEEKKKKRSFLLSWFAPFLHKKTKKKGGRKKKKNIQQSQNCLIFSPPLFSSALSRPDLAGWNTFWLFLDLWQREREKEGERERKREREKERERREWVEVLKRALKERGGEEEAHSAEIGLSGVGLFRNHSLLLRLPPLPPRTPLLVPDQYCRGVDEVASGYLSNPPPPITVI